MKQRFDYNNFSDPAFKAAMEEQCLQESVEYIDPSVAFKLRISDAKSLCDLKYFESLESLSVGMVKQAPNTLNDIKLCSHLRVFKIFTVTKNLSNFGAIWEKPALEELSIYASGTNSNEIGLENILKLKKLKKLSLSEIEICDKHLSLLTGLSRLKHLRLDDCALMDISFLKELSAIHALHLSRNRIKDISALKGFTELKELSLLGNNIADLSIIRNFTNLRWLGVTGRANDLKIKLSECEFWERLTGFAAENITLSATDMKKAKSLKNLLLIGYDDISFLSGNTSITEFSAFINSFLESFNVLLTMPNLNTVSIKCNRPKKKDLSILLFKLASKGIQINQYGEYQSFCTELNLHTNYSLDGSMISPARLSESPILGCIAVTDYNSVSAYPELTEYFGKTDLGVRLIYGMELETRDGSVTLLAKNMIGLENIYKLAQLLGDDPANAVLTRKQLLEHREGLLIGSGSNSKLFDALRQNKSYSMLKKLICDFDYLELPAEYFGDRELTRGMIKLSKKAKIPVCAVSDAHVLDNADVIAANINNADMQQNSRLLLDNSEKEKALSYLDTEDRKKIIWDDPISIFEQTEDIDIYARCKYREIDSADEMLKAICFENARKLFGAVLPEIVERRITEELDIIKKHATASLFLIAHSVAEPITEADYPVFSRGCLAASFAAHLLGLTLTDPLPPYRLCRKCGRFELVNGVLSGLDAAQSICPDCGETMICGGQNIPCEAVFGADGSRIPDFSLNTWYDAAKKAVAVLKRKYGDENVLYASKINNIGNTLARVKIKNSSVTVPSALFDDVLNSLADLKAQQRIRHEKIYILPDQPDGSRIVPQFTSHGEQAMVFSQYLHDKLFSINLYSYFSAETAEKLQSATGVPFRNVTIEEEALMLLCTQKDPKSHESITDNADADGLPKLAYIPGTEPLLNSLIKKLQPKCFSDYVQVFALLRSTDVWGPGSLQEQLFDEGKISKEDIISTRDDVYDYLLKKGMDKKDAYDISETVRKGRCSNPAVAERISEKLERHGVSQTMTNILCSIGFLFPRVHSCEYVAFAAKLAWYKLHFAMEFAEVSKQSKS